MVSEKIQDQEQAPENEDSPETFHLDKAKEETWHDWGILQDLLDKIVDAKEKVLFLQTIVSKNDYLCYNGECPIFGDIRQLRSEVMDLGLKYTTIEKIRLSDLTRFEKLNKLNDLQEIFFSCDDLLQEMMRIAASNRARMSRLREENEIRLTIVRELNKSKFPIPFQAGKEVQEGLDGFLGWEGLEEEIKKQNEKKEEDKK